MLEGLERIHEALVEHTPPGFPDDEDAPRPDGSVLVAWAVVVEWMTPEGERYIQRFGPEEQSRTMQSGLLWEGLNW